MGEIDTKRNGYNYRSLYNPENDHFSGGREEETEMSMRTRECCTGKVGVAGFRRLDRSMQGGMGVRWREHSRENKYRGMESEKTCFYR